MPNIIELSQHDGKRIGIPPGTGLIILDQSAAPPHEKPKTKTLIRYTLGMNQARLAWVRDEFDQVLNLFPMAYNGVGWTRAVELASGAPLAFPSGHIGAYEELEGGFRLTLDIPTGPVDVEVKATFDEVKRMMGENPPPAAPARKPAQRKKAAAGAGDKKGATQRRTRGGGTKRSDAKTE